MSTKIYNAVKINTTSMKALVAIGRQMQSIEIPALVQTLGAMYSLQFSEELKEALYDTYHSESGNETVRATQYSTQRLLREAITRFVGATMVNETVITNERDEQIFMEDLCKAFSGFGFDKKVFAPFIEIIEEVVQCRSVSFISSSRGFTLMKWYNLMPATERWVTELFEDYEYQDQTDGPPLNELDSELHKAIEEAAAGLRQEQETQPDEMKMFVDRVKSVLSHTIEHYIYEQRGEVWDEALGEAFSFSDASLNFNLFSGFMNSEKYVCERIVRTACLPAEKQNAVALKLAIDEKQMDEECQVRFKNQ